MTDGKIYDALQVASVVLIAATFIVAAFAVVVGNRIKRASDKEIAEIKLDLANASVKLEEERGSRVKAETRLLELQKAVSWRHLDKIFTETLKQSQPATAEIIYLAGEDEIYVFARSIHDGLLAAGWTVKIAAMKDINHDVPLALRLGGVIASGTPGLNILASNLEGPGVNALIEAFRRSGHRPVPVVPFEAARPSTGMKIIVGSRL